MAMVEDVQADVVATMPLAGGPTVETIEARMLAAGSTLALAHGISLKEGLHQAAGIFGRVQAQWPEGEARRQAQQHAQIGEVLAELLREAAWQGAAPGAGGDLVAALEAIGEDAEARASATREMLQVGAPWASEALAMKRTARARRARLLARHLAGRGATDDV